MKNSLSSGAFKMWTIVFLCNLFYANASAQYVSMQTSNYPDMYMRVSNAQGITSKIQNELDKKDASFRIAKHPNASCSECIFIESVTYPGKYLRHYKSQIILTTIANDLERKDASFLQRKGLAGVGTSYESYNFPNHFIRHANSVLLIAPRVNDGLFDKDASFIEKSSLYKLTEGEEGRALREGMNVQMKADDAARVAKEAFERSPQGQAEERAKAEKRTKDREEQSAIVAKARADQADPVKVAARAKAEADRVAQAQAAVKAKTETAAKAKTEADQVAQEQAAARTEAATRAARAEIGRAAQAEARAHAFSVAEEERRKQRGAAASNNAIKKTAFRFGLDLYIRAHDSIVFLSKIETDAERYETSFAIMPGLIYPNTYKSFESVFYPGKFLKRQGNKLVLATINSNSSEEDKEAACFALISVQTGSIYPTFKILMSKGLLYNDDSKLTVIDGAMPNKVETNKHFHQVSVLSDRLSVATAKNLDKAIYQKANGEKGSFSLRNGTYWEDRNAKNAVIGSYKEIRRDNTSIYLKDEARNIEIQIDVSSRRILSNPIGTSQQTIVASITSVKPYVNNMIID